MAEPDGVNWKRKRIVDPKAIRAARKPWCEFCGCYAGSGIETEVHHIVSRGARGDDVPGNLISLCSGFRSGWCHRRYHDGQISREDLLEIVSRRDNLD